MDVPEADRETAARHPIFAALLRRPVTALMLFVLLFVLGAVSYDRIPILLFPKGLSDPEMTVWAEYPNASPHEVSEKVTRPIEDAVRTMPGITRVQSRSSANNARIRVRFSSTTDMDQAYNELSDRLERTKPSFPDEVETVGIWRWNDSEMPIFWLGILYDDDVDDPFGTVEDVIQPRLESVDGVAQVRAWGMVQDSVRIFVTPEKLRSHGVGLYEVVSALRRDNFTLPAGSIEDGGSEFLLRIDSSFRSLDEIRAYPVRTNVQVGDVAEVTFARSYRDQVSRVNGKFSITTVINKESDENTVDVCRRVTEQLAQLEEDPRLAGYSFNVYFDQSEMIVSALDNLKGSMSWGALFAILVLYLFVRRLATTLMVAVAIPVSLMGAMVAVYFTGFTFNLISLAGFTLAIGMLVDNSVVVAENIARLRARGLPPFSAAVSGASQVGLAIMLATLTTIAMFAPLVFMASGKNMRIFLGELAAPITFSLVASLLVALVFLPIATIHLVRRRATAGRETVAYAGRNRLLDGYRAALAFTLRHRFGLVVTTLAVVSLGAFAGQNLEQRFEGGDGEGNRLEVDVTLPKRFTLAEAADVFEEIETYFLGRREELSIRDVSTQFDRSEGEVSLWFEREDGKYVDVHELSRSLRRELPEIPGVEYRMGFERSEEGSIRVQLEGSDPAVLARIGDELVDRLEALPELTNVRTDLEEGNDELRVTIDRDRAQRFGVGQETLQGIIAWGVGGQRLPDYRGGKRAIPLLVEYEEPEVGDLNYLKSLDVPVEGGGGTVPLAALTRYSFERSFGSIRRQDGVTSLGISAQSFDKNSYRIQRKVAEVLDAYPFPDGYGWRDTGGRQEWEEGMREMAIGLVTGFVFMILLMGMLFESVVLPFAVLFAVPLALTGANLGLYVTGMPMDSTAQLAFFLLAGVVVNNGIVLVDRIRQVREEGSDRATAVLDGCAQRLRPVLMTALTTMFGLVPMALPEVFAASRNTGLNYQSLAVATLGGLIVSTALTLLVVPLFYTLFDDLG
ncbi:MAG: efflux RND transporter permease subunit, partial [Planctomycetota bacterium JB042]